MLSQLANATTGSPRGAVADALREQAKERKMVSGTMGLAEGHPAHILDAVELLEAAWNDVTPATIAR